MKSKIIPTLVNTSANAEMLSTVPHRQMLDLSVVYRIIEEDESGFSAALVTEDLLRELKLDFEELEAIGLENFSRQYGAETFELTDTLKVMTNRLRLFGATGILYGELLKETSDSFGRDFYIVPVSVHEMMLVPEGAMSTEALKEILKEGNRNIASAEEFLSENIYRYSEGKLETVTV
ncbi:MAG: hypothetical protein J6M22_02255 [Firmicutes bacterium]|nr:hypothetical protein [Bacillota bacterium]